MRFHGKVSVVTGSTAGIGFAIARRFIQEGSKVVVSSRNQENVDRTVSKLQETSKSLKNGSAVSGVVCHIAKEPQREKLIKHTLEKFGQIDVLVNNATVSSPFKKVADELKNNPELKKTIRFMGMDQPVRLFRDTVAYANVMDIEKSHLDKVFETNVTSSFLLSKNVVPYMEKLGGGSILFISSFGAFLPIEFTASYSASKTALIGLTKTMSVGLASRNIRVNCLAPGLIGDTDYVGAVLENPEFIKALLQATPMQRFGLAEEMAGPAAFLCSEDASFITGETILAAGGMHCRF